MKTEFSTRVKLNHFDLGYKTWPRIESNRFLTTLQWTRFKAIFGLVKILIFIVLSLTGLKKIFELKFKNSINVKKKFNILFKATMLKAAQTTILIIFQ